MKITSRLVSYISRHYSKLYPESMFIGIAGDWGIQEISLICKSVLSEKFSVLLAKQGNILKLHPAIKKVLLEIMDTNNFITPATLIVNNMHNRDDSLVKLVSDLPEYALLILNYDDINVRKLSENTKARVIFYGSDKENCPVWYGNAKIENFSTSFEINYGVERVRIDSVFLGEYQIYPILAAACLGLNEGFSLTGIKNALKKMEQTDHKLQPFVGFNNSIIIDDTYSSSPILIEQAIDTLMKMPARRHILVLGELKDLKIESEKAHRRIAQKIFKEKVDLVFLGIGEAEFVYDELKRLGFLTERVEANLQNPQIAARLLKVLTKGDICLISGGLSSKFNEIVSRIGKKYE